MALDDGATPDERPQPKRREPISPAKRKRLQQCFEHASKQMAQENHDYATELFGQCVAGDPANVIYVQNYIGNLQRKYDNNKKGAGMMAQLQVRGARSSLKKAASAEDWDEVIRQGLKVLMVNPWDVPVLTSMATASEKMGDEEPELVYLKTALEANPKDPDVNVHCAEALARRREFDQALACLHRAQKARPNDEEIQRMTGRLAVEKTIYLGKYEDDLGGKFAGEKKGQPGDPGRELTMEERLEASIRRDPEDLAHYFELAQLHINNEQYKKAEDVFARAFEVSGGDPEVRERWEDAQIRHLRHQIVQASNRGDEEARKNLRQELIQKELEVYKNRAERYPNNLGFKYDLGIRYQLAGEWNEAIKQFQLARNDPRRKGLCLLALGQCFQQVKQYRLARSSYEEATKEIPDRDADNKKKSLYLLARLLIFLKELDSAEQILTHLAALDFTYKDVSELLDKVGRMREGGEADGPVQEADI
jgi:tetratricopeptide (TPR) repeat protein